MDFDVYMDAGVPKQFMNAAASDFVKNAAAYHRHDGDEESDDDAGTTAFAVMPFLKFPTFCT